MTALMQHPAVVVAIVVILCAAWFALIVFMPFDEEIESLDPWPPDPRPVPSNVRLLIGQNIYDFETENPWLADDGL